MSGGVYGGGEWLHRSAARRRSAATLYTCCGTLVSMLHRELVKASRGITTVEAVQWALTSNSLCIFRPLSRQRVFAVILQRCNMWCNCTLDHIIAGSYRVPLSSKWMNPELQQCAAANTKSTNTSMHRLDCVLTRGFILPTMYVHRSKNHAYTCITLFVLLLHLYQRLLLPNTVCFGRISCTKPGFCGYSSRPNSLGWEYKESIMVAALTVPIYSDYCKTTLKTLQNFPSLIDMM